MFLPVFVHPSANLQKVVARFQGLGIEVLQAAFRSRQVLKVFSEQGLSLAEYVDIGRYARERVQAREALSNIQEIAEQITLELGKK